MDGSNIRPTQTGRRCDQGIEHGPEIESRAADDLEHVGGGCLLLQRLAELVEQPGVLDRDYCLRTEIRDQFDLLVAERPHLLPVNGDRTD